MAHGDLDHAMKLAERKTQRHQNAPPHHRADPGQPEFDLEDRVGVRREVLCRNERLRPSFHPARLRLLPLSLSVAGHPRDPDALHTTRNRRRTMSRSRPSGNVSQPKPNLPHVSRFIDSGYSD
jgi:hypothetical protein